MTPSPKSPQMEQFLELMSGRTSAIKSNLCVPSPFGCGKPIGEFTDSLSIKEYTISGLCQTCQDRMSVIRGNHSLYK
jgi:hypothetical protein